MGHRSRSQDSWAYLVERGGDFFRFDRSPSSLLGRERELGVRGSVSVMAICEERREQKGAALDVRNENPRRVNLHPLGA